MLPCTEGLLGSRAWAPLRSCSTHLADLLERRGEQDSIKFQVMDVEQLPQLPEFLRPALRKWGGAKGSGV